MERKAVAGLEVKAAEKGEAVVRFAMLGGPPDLDGDIIAPGAIGRQRVKVSSYGHTSWGGSLPVGVGETRESGNAAIADLRFFLNTQHGRDHWETVKGLGDLQEYSFGFDVEDAGEPSPEERKAGAKRVLKRLRVFEISPVLRAAGRDTATLAMKAQCTGCGSAVSGAALERRGREILERARRTRADARKLLERLDGVDQPDPARRELAAFAAWAGHILNGLPGRVQPPAVKWFDRNTDPDLRNTNGFMRPGEHATHLAIDLAGADLVRTALHELRHVAQRDPEAAGAESDAAQFAQRWTSAVVAAHRHTGGRTWKLRTSGDRWPPFRGAHRKGDVILQRERGEAWAFYPRAVHPWHRIST